MPATIGQAAPAFAADAVMPDGSFKSVKLADYKGAPRVERLACQPWLTQARRDAGKYVVLFFYPLDFTFVCPVSAPAPRVRTASPSCGATTEAASWAPADAHARGADRPFAPLACRRRSAPSRTARRTSRR